MGRPTYGKSIAASAKTKDLTAMATAMASFIRMYRPHEAAKIPCSFRRCTSWSAGHEYDAMGEQFEKFERKTFGGDGFRHGRGPGDGAGKNSSGSWIFAQFTPR